VWPADGRAQPIFAKADQYEFDGVLSHNYRCEAE
jgi:hypothetical protein